MDELQVLDSFFDDHFGAHDNSSQSSQSQPQIPPTPEVFDDGESSDDDLGSNDDDDENVNDIVNRFVQNQDQDAQDQEEEPYYNVNELPNLKLNEACGCSNECFKRFPSQEVVDHIWMIRSLDKNEKEIQIMTLLKTFGIDSSTTRRGDRKRTVYQYRFSDKKVCHSAFMVFYDIHDFTLRSLISHIHEHGVSTRIHGNTGKKAKHELVFDDVKRVVKFLDSYASEHGLPQPAAPRGRPDIPPIYLHSSLTKTSVHKIYVDSLSNEDVRVVKITAFCEIWKSCVPHIQIASPRLDVCATCETSRKQVMDAVSEQAKLDATNSMRDHLLTAQNERELYMSMIRRSQDNNGDQNNFVHYTFDFAQNVTLPHHARQMGPLYFLSLKKVQVFGFRNDGIPRQLNYLFDEAQTIGVDGKLSHGPNAVISMVDHGLSVADHGEESCSFHADNCVGQNKNRFIIGYFLWRVMTGRHQEIALHFQIPGHTRCLIDAGFANFKRLYRRSDADCLQDLQQQVNLSSTVNEAVMYPEWQWRDWKTFLDFHFKGLRGIASYQHFRFTHDKPGVVLIKQTPVDEEVEVQMLRDPEYRFTQEDIPRVLLAPGVSRERQTYLYRNVRRYVRDIAKDLTCPRPSDAEE